MITQNVFSLLLSLSRLKTRRAISPHGMHTYILISYYMFDPWVGKIPWRKKRLPTPVFCPENSMESVFCPEKSMGSQRVQHDWGAFTFRAWKLREGQGAYWSLTSTQWQSQGHHLRVGSSMLRINRAQLAKDHQEVQGYTWQIIWLDSNRTVSEHQEERWTGAWACCNLKSRPKKSSLDPTVLQGMNWLTLTIASLIHSMTPCTQ